MLTTHSTNWTYDEFSTFTLLYAASADMVITPEEEKMLIQRLDQDRYKALKEVFDNSNDKKIIDLILSYREKYLPTESAKEKLLKEIRQVFEVDRDYSIVERNVMNLFRRIL